MTILNNFPYRQKGELLGVVISAILALLLLCCSVFLIVVTPESETIDPVILDTVGLAALFPFTIILIRRFSQAKARETFLPVTPQQFPEIHEYLVAASEHFGLKTIPAAYLVSSPSADPCSEDHGVRPSVWIGIDFYSGCRENNTPEALRFMVTHQVAHIAAGHGSSLWSTLCGVVLSTPYLRSFLTRRMEYTADAAAASLALNGAVDAIHLCAVGKDNYIYANAQTQLSTAASKTGFLGWLARTFADHPSAARRITKISQNR